MTASMVGQQRLGSQSHLLRLVVQLVLMVRTRRRTLSIRGRQRSGLRSHLPRLVATSLTMMQLVIVEVKYQGGPAGRADRVKSIGPSALVGLCFI